MGFIDEKGRIFGIINIFDLTILIFIVVFIASLFLSIKFPPQLKEHRDVVFQMYFKGAPLSAVNGDFSPSVVQYAVGKQVFVQGNKLIATYEKRDKAVITSVKEVTDELGNINFLVTINASLEVDAQGNYLFNGNNVAPGNVHNVQVESSYLWGKIWRVNYKYYVEKKEVILSTNKEAYDLYSKGDIVYDLSGNSIGNITGKMEPNYMVALIVNEVYDGERFVNEIPIKLHSPFYFMVNNSVYKGIIVGVSK